MIVQSYNPIILYGNALVTGENNKDVVSAKHVKRQTVDSTIIALIKRNFVERTDVVYTQKELETSHQQNQTLRRYIYIHTR